MIVPVGHAFLLGGVAFGSLVMCITGSKRVFPTAFYLGSLALFHFLEYFLQATHHPTSTSSSAFLLDHSQEYTMALVAALTELAVGSLLVPQLKTLFAFRLVGSGLVLGGMLMRVLAMATAASNFSHTLRSNLATEHALITHGIYRVVRHPSYAGFYLFVLGGQILLGNPVCGVLYALVLHKFFRDRICVEEQSLMRQYPKQYVEYRQRTWSGVPFLA